MIVFRENKKGQIIADHIRVAVICQDQYDFDNLLQEKKLTKYTPKIALGRDKAFYRVATELDACSMEFDEIIEGENASNNENYNELLVCVKGSIRQ